MKSKLFAVVFMALAFFSTISIKAVTQTSTNTATQKIRDEIQKKVEEKVKGIINEKKKKGWVGIVKSKDEVSLKLETTQGEEREVLIDPETTVISSKRKKISLNKIVVGKKLLAMGYLNGENILLGKRIISLEKEEPVNHFASFGTVSDRSISQKIITLTPSANKDQALEIVIINKTKISSFEKDDLGYDDLVPGSKVAIIYQNNPKDEKEKQALVIKIVSLVKPTNTPTPSLSPTPSGN